MIEQTTAMPVQWTGLGLNSHGSFNTGICWYNLHGCGLLGGESWNGRTFLFCLFCLLSPCPSHIQICAETCYWARCCSHFDCQCYCPHRRNAFTAKKLQSGQQVSSNYRHSLPCNQKHLECHGRFFLIGMDA